MNVAVNGREIVAPWPATSMPDERGCFGRPHAHPIADPERLLAYFQALDSPDASERWETLEIRMHGKVA